MVHGNDREMGDDPDSMTDRKGLLYAFLAYAGWGLLPMYWKLFEAMSPYELLAYRILWSAVFVWLLVVAMRRVPSTVGVMGTGPRAGWMALGSVLITANWLTYIVAVNTGHVVESSLGYYINPLVNVLLGLVFLRERLTAVQWLAMAIAAAGVAVMMAAYGQVPWLALLLAGTFGFYGLVKKKVSVEATESLTWETTLVLPIAAVYLIALALTHASTVNVLTPWRMVVLCLSGVVTAIPLLWFAMAAKRLNMATLGMVQYVSPTLQLVLGVWVYHEPFTQADAIAFSCIWAALLLYTLTLWRQQRMRTMSPASAGVAAGGPS